MKKLLFLLIVLLSAFTLVSCGKDKDKGNDNPTQENPGTQNPTGNPGTQNPTQNPTGNPGTQNPTQNPGSGSGTNNPEHEHTFVDVWHADENEHWEECECGEKGNVEAHTPIENSEHEANVCSVCNAVYTTKYYENLTSLGINPSEPHTAYQVLIYSYYDSDGDGYGDLKGLESKLDYLNDLGVDVIWLSPIMESESYHAYDITSFYKIDPKIGTIDDYLSLVDSAHAKNMKIVLDMPINHTSINHVWFLEYLNGNPDYAEHYQEKDPSVFYGTNSSMGDKAKFYTDAATGKTYFAAFGATMPDLNYQSDSLKGAIYDVFDYWMALGADGFRFDAVKHLYDPNEIPSNASSINLNKQFFQELGAHLKEKTPNVYLLGENFSGQGEVLEYADSFDAEFDFDSWHTSVGAVNNADPWGQSNRRGYYDDNIVGNTNALIAKNPNWIPTFMTGNHDVTRVASYFDNVSDKPTALKLYAAMVMLRSGIPFIYYGDEIGMVGTNKSGDYKVEDSQIRLPMNFSDTTITLTSVFYTKMVDKQGNLTGKTLGENMMQDWPNYASAVATVEAQLEDPTSLLNTYKQLIALRETYPAIYKGTMDYHNNGNGYAGKGTIISFTYENETIYVAFNFSESSLSVSDLAPNMDLTEIYSLNNSYIDGANIELGARGVLVFTCASTLQAGSVATNGGDTPYDPSAKYQLVVNGSTYFNLTHKGDAWVDGVKHDEYYATFIHLEAGDIVTLCDPANSAEWAITNVNPWSSGSPVGTSTGIIIGETGDYDIYVQFLYGQDKIYFGPAGA